MAGTRQLTPDVPGQRHSHDITTALFSRDELAMLSLFAEGWCVTTIARRLSMSDRTVRRRSRMLCDRLNASSIIQVVAWAARRGLI
ncbi:LuxR C-terminal-related transcriptional regulator [Ruania alba]|nr:LuxR C-terminal-related transcriptional regulator [Ruania alba]